MGGSLSQLSSIHPPSLRRDAVNARRARNASKRTPSTEHPWTRMQSLRGHTSRALHHPPLEGATHPGAQSSPPALPCNPEPLHALARSARSYLADIPARQPAYCHRLHDTPAGQERTLGPRLRARAAERRCKPGCLRSSSNQRALEQPGEKSVGEQRHSRAPKWTCTGAQPGGHSERARPRVLQPTSPRHLRSAWWCYASSRPTTSSSGASTAAFGACRRPLNWGVSLQPGAIGRRRE